MEIKHKMQFCSSFTEATFREISLPSLGNVNDMSSIVELADLDKKTLHNVTN